MRRASIKETGEELSQREWQRFDEVAAQVKRDKRRHEGDLILSAPTDGRSTDYAAPRTAGQA